jgi:hypothetical protein
MHAYRTQKYDGVEGNFIVVEYSDDMKVDSQWGEWSSGCCNKYIKQAKELIKQTVNTEVLFRYSIPDVVAEIL